MKINGIYDLSVTLRTNMPAWPTNPLITINPVGTVARDGYSVESYASATHSGTHIDAPSHMIEKAKTVDKVELDKLIGEGYCIRPELDGREIGRSALAAVWKPEYDGKIILINTGWDRKRDYTKEFQFNFPGLAMDTVDFFVEHRTKVIGIDTLGIEPYGNSDFRVHKALLVHDMAFIEDMANLDQLKEGKKYLVVALPLKIENGSGAMARVVALDVA